MLLSLILGALSPRDAWRWGLWMAGGQFAIAFLLDPGANLLPLGTIVFGILGCLISVPGLIGARIRVRVEARQAAVH